MAKVFGRQKQEGYIKFKTILVYIASPWRERERERKREGTTKYMKI